MTPPKTDTEKQARRHWMPLAALICAATIGVGFILYWLAADVLKPADTVEEPEPGTQDVSPGKTDLREDAPVVDVDPPEDDPGTNPNVGVNP